uniref:Uncharacterized protein n=1 Tax=viral metagenome TaxID=1070528 RepID=A0A6M3JI90_9ZZZZ
MKEMINKDNLNLKWFICFLLRRHKWGYYSAGGKANYNCSCESDDCCSIPVYDLVCLRCGLSITLGEDELIGCFAKRIVNS